MARFVVVAWERPYLEINRSDYRFVYMLVDWVTVAMHVTLCRELGDLSEWIRLRSNLESWLTSAVQPLA